MAAVPLQAGYVVQPQNWLPWFFPLLAVRSAMSEPHFGQAGGFRSDESV
jgi:hypothetical protein